MIKRFSNFAIVLSLVLTAVTANWSVYEGINYDRTDATLSFLGSNSSDTVAELIDIIKAESIVSAEALTGTAVTKHFLVVNHAYIPIIQTATTTVSSNKNKKGGKGKKPANDSVAESSVESGAVMNTGAVLTSEQTASIKATLSTLFEDETAAHMLKDLPVFIRNFCNRLYSINAVAAPEIPLDSELFSKIRAFMIVVNEKPKAQIEESKDLSKKKKGNSSASTSSAAAKPSSASTSSASGDDRVTAKKVVFHIFLDFDKNTDSDFSIRLPFSTQISSLFPNSSSELLLKCAQAWKTLLSSIKTKENSTKATTPAVAKSTATAAPAVSSKKSKNTKAEAEKTIEELMAEEEAEKQRKIEQKKKDEENRKRNKLENDRKRAEKEADEKRKAEEELRAREEQSERDRARYQAEMEQKEQETLAAMQKVAEEAARRKAQEEAEKAAEEARIAKEAEAARVLADRKAQDEAEKKRIIAVRNAERKAAEQRKRELVRIENERKAAEQKENEIKAARIEADRKAAELKENEIKAARIESERKAAEVKAAAEIRANQIKEAERIRRENELKEREAERIRKETERKEKEAEAERKEAERKEAERKEAERKEAERKEAERLDLIKKAEVENLKRLAAEEVEKSREKDRLLKQQLYLSQLRSSSNKSSPDSDSSSSVASRTYSPLTTKKGGSVNFTAPPGLGPNTTSVPLSPSDLKATARVFVPTSSPLSIDTHSPVVTKPMPSLTSKTVTPASCKSKSSSVLTVEDAEGNVVEDHFLDNLLSLDDEEEEQHKISTKISETKDDNSVFNLDTIFSAFDLKIKNSAVQESRRTFMNSPAQSAPISISSFSPLASVSSAIPLESTSGLSDFFKDTPTAGPTVGFVELESLEEEQEEGTMLENDDFDLNNLNESDESEELDPGYFDDLLE